MRYFDKDGNELTFVAGPASGFSVNCDGTVTRFREDPDGGREEWTEHISESPLQGLFAGWLWDLTLDPRDS